MCIESITKQNYKDYKVIICDDASTDNTSEIIKKEFPFVKVVSGNGNLWWSGGTNECVKEALKTAGKEDYIFTLNNDTELLPDTLHNLIQFAQKNKNSIVGAVNVFYSAPDRIEPSAFIKKNNFFLKKLHHRIHEFGESIEGKSGVVEVDVLSGKGVLIPVKVFKEIGFYNYEKLPHYHADTEFIIRAKNYGYKVFLSYEAKVLSHQELTGIGTINTNPNFFSFIKSFFSRRSANHLLSLYNYTKILYGKTHLIYFAFYFIKIFGGFFKRKLRINEKK
jgi:GT2 family glycosyltransferase